MILIYTLNIIFIIWYFKASLIICNYLYDQKKISKGNYNFHKWNIMCSIYCYLERVTQILLLYFYFECLVTGAEELRLHVFWINAFCLQCPKPFFSKLFFFSLPLKKYSSFCFSEVLVTTLFPVILAPDSSSLHFFFSVVPSPLPQDTDSSHRVNCFGIHGLWGPV